MKKINNNGFSAIDSLIILFVIVIIGTAGWIVWQKNSNSSESSKDRGNTHKRDLSLDEIREKFNCDRITMDAKETDVFCGNPIYYNHPDKVTLNMYRDELGCQDRLNNPPPPSSDIYRYYETCKDDSRLDAERQEFIERLKQLKGR